jgi:hypothetical protein
MNNGRRSNKLTVHWRALSEQKAGSKAYKSIERSLKRLGKPGEKNGVVVTIGTVSRPDAGGETDPRESIKAP